MLPHERLALLLCLLLLRPPSALFAHGAGGALVDPAAPSALLADPSLLSRELYRAVTTGNATKVEMWLALGVDADLADVDDPDEGETPLLRAAANNRAAVMELLLQHGADAMHTNSEGKTALMTAASFGHVRAMRILFLYPPYSATVPTSEMVAVDSSPRKPEDAQDRLGKTALAWAAYMGKVDAVRELLDRGVDMELSDRNDGLPVVHALLEAGASPTTKDDDGASALNWALERGRRDILSVIAKYEYGADTELLETSGI